jgi:hypothetical protein
MTKLNTLIYDGRGDPVQFILEFDMYWQRAGIEENAGMIFFKNIVMRYDPTMAGEIMNEGATSMKDWKEKFTRRMRTRQEIQKAKQETRLQQQQQQQPQQQQLARRPFFPSSQNPPRILLPSTTQQQRPALSPPVPGMKVAPRIPTPVVKREPDFGIGPCFVCGKYGHLASAHRQTKIHSLASFKTPEELWDFTQALQLEELTHEDYDTLLEEPKSMRTFDQPEELDFI